MFIPCSQCGAPVLIFLHQGSIICHACVKALPQVSMIQDFIPQYLHSDLSLVDDSVIRCDLGHQDFGEVLS